jgi:hypothetical protein
MIVHIFILSIV